ncbi:GNAT family N-acetyltransferase [Kitasatospora azatica]|uniref:GNAT family N-acetyltransferase n=1 Tax=Kitasatospora azatica TaxID=58347 RepID=UPI00056547DC|nr:GNAT family N-acetyltransferase [Kitasatospora azatica]
MLLRSAVESDLDRFLPLLVADPGCSTVTAESYRTKLASGEYRLDRTWLAEQDGDLRAVAVWWGGAGSAAPQALDGIFTHPAVGTGPERTALAAELLRAAHTAFGDSPSYHVFLPGDWREQPAVLAALTWRQQAARQAGLTGELERLRFEWRPEVCPEPAPPGTGLEFAEEPDDEVFVELFRRVIAGSLDSDSTTGAAKVGAEQQAREDVAFYRDEMLGERSWWRVARNAAGELVGFGLPSRNHSFPVVGYLGVLPEHRGHGHAESILAEITRILIAETAPAEIRADTDLGNHPMAAAFLRTGYRNSARRLVLSAD